MICSEAILLPIFAFILWLHESEVLQCPENRSSSYISRYQADDLISCVAELLGKPINENNIRHVITCLRDRKANCSQIAIGRVIKLLLRTLG